MTTFRARLGTAFDFVKDVASGFSDDRAEILAAALAFYTLLSLAPLVIIAVAVAGTLLGHAEARQEVTRMLTEATSGTVAATVNGWVDEASKSTGIASFVGGALLLAAASRLFEQLKTAMNQVFEVKTPEEVTLKTTVVNFVLQKLIALAMVLGVGVALIAVVVSRTALSAASERIVPTAGALAGVGQVAFSLVIVAIATVMLFKLVPDKKLGWRAVMVGAVTTSVLFNIGNVLLGLYLGRATVTATYGAAGSVVVVLLWFFYSAQILFLGAEVAHEVDCRARKASARPRDGSGADAARSRHEPLAAPSR